jgi:hypothetical protein
MKKETVLYVLSFCLIIMLGSCAPKESKESWQKVDIDAAKSLNVAFKIDSTWLCDSIQGVVIDTLQLIAMNNLLNNGVPFDAYRIYLGYDVTTMTKVANIVGMTNTGLDVFKGDIFTTDLGLTGPCPPTCDVNRSAPVTVGTRIFACGTFKAFAIDKEAVQAMNDIKANDPKCKGFRIYYAFDKTRTTGMAAIITGIDANMNDLLTIVKTTTLVLGGPCPTVCDVNSPLN